ncbi:MAG: response regulator transcription factor [Xanthomonadales bacterium]|nr:response regulator transcription factor [Xanthomonadales bacterium]
MQILLVEDNLSLAKSLVTALGREGFTTNHVATGAEALLAVETDPPELVILDLGLPDMDGMDVLREMNRGARPLPVLVLTARDTTADKVSGLNLGADDYLAKPFDMSELFARLRALERRTALLQTVKIAIGPVVLDTLTHEVRVDDEPVEMTRRELMLLKALMENPGRVLSRDKLEGRIYGWGEELASNSIEVHIHNLRKKIPAGFIKTIRGVGYSIQER